MEFTEKRIESEEVFSGHVFKVYKDKVQLSDGSIRGRDLVFHNGGVCVVALTDDRKVYMVRQFRYGVGKPLLEIPAGKLEAGEDPFEAAKRELSEETGCTAEKWISLGEMYPTPGYCSEILYTYFATGLKKGEMKLDDGEILETELVDFDELVNAIMDGKIGDAKTVFGVFKVQNLLKNKKI